MIEVSALTKYYAQTRAIHELSFTIGEGQIVGFLGLNGAGKSTALKILAGFLLPTSGTVRIDGVDLVAEPEAMRSRIGFLPEEPPLYKDMTVTGFLQFLGKLRGMSSSAVAARLPSVLQRTALTDRKDDVIATLSLGYRKRVGIAQAIIHDPKLVILDEPVSGLDPLQRVEMRKLVRELGGQHTVLISSHNLDEVEQTCDRLLILDEGHIVAEGTEDEILHRVGGRGRIELTVVGDAGRASAIVAGVPGVSSVEPGPAREGGVDLAVAIDGNAHTIGAAIAAALFGGGLGLSRLEHRTNELEELFLSIAGAGAGAERGAA
jgi:ABC-2 type transport system ATP-binding protein